MTDKETDIKNLAQKLTEALVDQGKIIQGGWVGFCSMVFPETASQAQVIEMRKAFFAGAAHLFASVNAVLDNDREPTEKDMRRMTQIFNELREFEEEFKRQYPIKEQQ